MRQIKEIPQFYTDYLTKEKPKVWDDFNENPEIKNQLNKHIAQKEQFGVDAYTQQRLNSEQKHIDHYCKRSMFPELTFNYNNLFVSNHNNKYGADFKDNHISKLDYGTMYNPALNYDKFEFLESGEIHAKVEGDILANRSITIFNLKDEKLNSRRFDIFKSALSLSEQFDIDEVLRILKYEFHSGVKEILH